MKETRACTRYQQNSIAIQEQCGGEALVHICVQAPKVAFRAFYRSYLDTDHPLFHINYSSSSPFTFLYERQHKIVDTILMSEACNVHVVPMM